MRNSYALRVVFPVIVLLLCTIFASAAISAQAAMSDGEYKALLKNQWFKKADDSLRSAYKSCLASAKTKAEKNEIIKNQRQWIKMRDEEATRRFRKGSPAYVQYLIDKTVHQADTLEKIASGNSMSIKADGFFDTLDYDNIPFEGSIKAKNKINR